jgi:hypothetical protein
VSEMVGRIMQRIRMRASGAPENGEQQRLLIGAGLQSVSPAAAAVLNLPPEALQLIVVVAIEAALTPTDSDINRAHRAAFDAGDGSLSHDQIERAAEYLKRAALGGAR